MPYSVIWAIKVEESLSGNLKDFPHENGELCEGKWRREREMIIILFFGF
jgi:hypothetical protein